MTPKQFRLSLLTNQGDYARCNFFLISAKHAGQPFFVRHGLVTRHAAFFATRLQQPPPHLTMSPRALWCQVLYLVAGVALLFEPAQAVSEGLRSRTTVSSAEMQLLLDRLDALERENSKLRDRLDERLSDDEGASVAGTPSFHHDARETSDDTMFVEMEEGGQAKVVETEKEDPTIECQTVCKFVRPNSASKLNSGQDAQSAIVQQAMGAAE